MFKKFLSKFSRKDVLEFKEQKYLAVVNDESHVFDSKEQMMSFIDSYSKNNVIYSLNLFKVDLFNLIK